LFSEKWFESQRKYRERSIKPMSREHLEYYVREGRAFMEFHNSSGLILDVGCGNGIYAGMRYEETGYKYAEPTVGIDPELIEKPHFPFVRAVAEYLPFRDEVFDNVVNATSLDHFADVWKATSECWRVLKKNGRLHIWVSLRGNPEKHVRTFTLDDLLMLHSGMRLEKLKRRSNTVFMTWRK